MRFNMKIQYVFVKKSESDVNLKNSNKLFQEMFKKIFMNVTFDTFDLNIDHKLQTISYKSSSSSNGIMYLTVSFNDSPAFSAKVLSTASTYLTQGNHRKDFYIINSYDEPSLYYCEKLAPRFGRFERLMRSFIYISLTKLLGVDWFKKTFTEEIKDAIKDKGNISDFNLIERGLHEMTFAQLYDYLFKEFSYCSAESAIYDHLLSRNLEDMSKDEIITIINSCKKECLWDRFFSETNFDLKTPLHNMREYRNKVAHNKFIKYNEYTECKRNLIKINTVLEDAITKVDSDIYTEKHISDTLMAFAALLTGLLKNEYDIVSTAQKNFSKLGEIIIKALEPYASVSKMENMYKLGAILSDLYKLTSETNANKSTEKTINSLLEPHIPSTYAESTIASEDENIL